MIFKIFFSKKFALRPLKSFAFSVWQHPKKAEKGETESSSKKAASGQKVADKSNGSADSKKPVGEVVCSSIIQILVSLPTCHLFWISTPGKYLQAHATVNVLLANTYRLILRVLASVLHNKFVAPL